MIAGNAVLLRYSRQLVGSCTINDSFRLILNIKVKFTLEEATEFLRGNVSIYLLFL